ncbi:nicotinic acid mononucleotide adenyltransferase [Leptobacterium sp. I13]|uniref:toxin-antitoxin system YwqK family antitoxin n=1 Tax=Leptobacterium meishanense TaxID=3128904 RepID=UPI0030ED6F95
MKNLMLTFAMLFSVVLIAQESKPTLEKEGDLIKATYFHDNGQISQTGYYLNDKPHGEWKAYNTEGEKIAMGLYDLGKKTGKWFFWTEGKLSEVNYEDSKIVSVTEWNKANSIAVNK